MKDYGLKTTLYDFMVYLLQGGVILFVGYLCYLHSKGNPDVMATLNEVMKESNLSLKFLFAFLSYLTGHLLSTLSCLLVEKLVFRKVTKLKSQMDCSNILSSSLYEQLCKKFKLVFDSNYEDDNFYACVCFNEFKRPQIYSTAFYFMVYYGMARNLSMTFFLAFLWETVNAIFVSGTDALPFLFTYIVVSFIFTYEYYRFYRSFKKHIALGFITPD
jgi:hypothetical protein